MGSTILEGAGWALFYCLLLFFVRWIAIERTCFAGQDPEQWEPEPLSQTPPADQPDLPRAARVPLVPSLGRPR